MDVRTRRQYWGLVADRIERRDPDALMRGLHRLDLWAERNGRTAADTYYARWRALIMAGPAAVVRQLRASGDDADTMRSCAPLQDVISQAERLTLLQRQREARNES